MSPTTPMRESVTSTKLGGEAGVSATTPMQENVTSTKELCPVIVLTTLQIQVLGTLTVLRQLRM